MKTKYLTTSLFTTLLLASTTSLVLAEPNYPEDFTPEIVYQDKDYIAEHGGSTESASTSSPASSSSSSSSSSDSKYPEDFTPEIVYQDKEYISKTKSSSASSSTPRKSSISKSSSASSSTTNDATSSETETSTGESGMNQYLIGLGVLLAAGAFLFSKRPASEGSSSAAAPAANTAPGGGTGVASYLKQHDMAEPTGVAKYLEQQTIANATGVEKYLQNS